MIMVILLDHWILIHFYILLIGDTYYILALSIRFINYHLDIILGFLNHSALDIILSSWDSLDIAAFWLQVSFSFLFL